MIYLFTGNNRYLIREEAQKWKIAFGEKYWEENVTHINSLETTSHQDLQQALTSRSLFTEKRLVIIDWFPFSWERNFSWAQSCENIILNALENIPEEVLVVFLSDNPDKRKIWYKTLAKLAEIKNFVISGEDEVYHILSQKYWDIIDSGSLKTLIFMKAWDLQKTIWEIEKLLVTCSKITAQDIQDNVMPEFEQSIFIFIDTILSKNSSKIFKEFENLLQYSNMYALYQSIIANLRVFLYIELLKSQKKSPQKIGDILKLWNRQFLINKSFKGSFPDIQKLYRDLLNFDKSMKFWKFISSDEQDLQKQLEGVFLEFLK